MNINDLFEIGPIGNDIVLPPVILALPMFKDIIDNVSDPYLARQEIKYILWKNCWNSPYMVVNPSIRESSIKHDVFKDDNYKLSEHTLNAEKRFVTEFQTSEVLEMLKATRQGIWFVTDYLISLKDSNDQDPEKILKMIGQLGNACKSLDILEKAAKSQIDLHSKVTGGREIGAYELPNR